MAAGDGAVARATAALLAGVLVGLVTVTYTMSYAALVFAGGLASAYGTGLAAMLVGGVAAGVLTALRSSIPFSVSAPDSNVVAILAVTLVPLAWQVADAGDPAVLAATVLMAIALASLATGLVLGGLGVARAGRLVRYVPLPVISGFLAASGWFLLVGGARVATDAAGLAGLFATEKLPQLLAALGGGLALYLAVGRLRGALVLPALILGGLLLHHGLAALLGAGMAAQHAGGWLPQAPGPLAWPLPWTPAMLAKVDWPALARHLPDLPLLVLAVAGVTIGFGSLLGLLAGLLLSCGHFIAVYGRASPLRARYDGTAAEGNRARPAEDSEALRATGTARLVMHLQGFLFFGTANRLLELVRAELAGPEQRTHLLLDFQEVVGLDSSAGMAFTRMLRVAPAQRVTLVLSGLSAATLRNLGPLATDPSVRLLSRLQDGIEWMEEDALAALPPRAPPPAFATRLAGLMGAADAARFLAALPVEEAPPGTVLMVQDEASDDVVLLEAGLVTIGIRLPGGHAIELRVDGPGVLIGELGFLLGTPRTATVTTQTACRLRRMDRAGLARLERESPDLGIWFHRLLGQLLAGRIQDKDRMINGLLRGLRPPEEA
ncbi:MAG: cyclic nucleotide-binding domain-containing protein [Paracraurococcus sp.]